jgi:hypothetical protein
MLMKVRFIKKVHNKIEKQKKKHIEKVCLKECNTDNKNTTRQKINKKKISKWNLIYDQL